MSLFRTYELVGLLLSGYVNSGNDMGDIDVEVARELNIPLSERSENVRPLFSDYVAAHGISKDEYTQSIFKKGLKWLNWLVVFI